MQNRLSFGESVVSEKHTFRSGHSLGNIIFCGEAIQLIILDCSFSILSAFASESRISGALPPLKKTEHKKDTGGTHGHTCVLAMPSMCLVSSCFPPFKLLTYTDLSTVLLGVKIGPISALCSPDSDRNLRTC